MQPRTTHRLLGTAVAAGILTVTLVLPGAPTLTAVQAQAARVACSDFNGDGRDLAIGVPEEDVTTSAGPVLDAGAVQVLYGQDDGLTATSAHQRFTQATPGVPGALEAFDRFGTALATGNFNGDRYCDLAIGVPDEAVGDLRGAGYVTVLYGGPSGLTTSGATGFHQGSDGVPGIPETGDAFGQTLAVGDFNADGVADLAISAPGEDLETSSGPITNAGSVTVLYGHVGSGLTSSGAKNFYQGHDGLAGTPEPDDFFGRSLATGDFNRDGYSDLAIGVPDETLGGLYAAGAVQVLYGRSGGLATTNAQLLTTTGLVAGVTPHAADYFGWALAAGDFNRDGYADLALSVVNACGCTGSGGVSAGAVLVLNGTAAGLTTQGVRLLMQGRGGLGGVAQRGEQFGWVLAVGDYNGDGAADLAISIPNEDVSTPGGLAVEAGAVQVVYGSASGLAATGNQRFVQGQDGSGVPTARSHYGSALAAGDVTGDGVAELAIGMPEQAIYGIRGAGMVQTLVGHAGSGLSTARDQHFWQGVNQVLGVPEQFDHFGAVLAAR